MADVNRIKLPDGNTYNLIDALGRKEAYLEWGGKNFTGSYGCIDAAMVSDLNANRFSFLKKAGITIEYTRNGGTTWTDYAATEQSTVGLFNPGSGFSIGKADSTNKATANGTNYQLRVTINASSAGIYTYITKVIIYCSTNGSADCKCQIFGTLKPSTDYTKITDPVAISGWSGYNVIQTGFTIGNSFNGQYNNVRFLFTANGGDTKYIGLNIWQILGFGGVGWTTPSTMAKLGHLYSYDGLQNATFPANITATKFIGPLQGNADTATNASKVNNHTVNADVPSGAVFTDTQANWTQTTSTALDYIKNKPTLGTASAKDVPASGNASTTQVVLGNDTRLTNSRTPTSHTHGNIQNGGTLQTNDITIASGDKIVVTDSSDSAKVARTSISFDGSTATKALTPKGTWETFGTSNLTLGTTSTTALKGDTKYAGSSSAGGSATSAVKLDTATAGSATQPCYFTGGKPSACTYSLNKTVPSNAVFTDTNNAVTQTATSTNANYEVLFSSTADNTTRTEGARKNSNLRFNPSTGALQANKLQGIDSSGKVRVEFYNDAENRGRFYLYNGSQSSQIEMVGDGVVNIKNASGTANITFNGNTGNINCTTINSHLIPKITFSNEQYSFTSNTTLSYIGKSITCDTGHRMLVRLYFRYVHGAPTETAASKNSTSVGGYFSECIAYGASGASNCLTFMLVGGETVYLFAKYSNASANRVDIATVDYTNEQ